MSTYQWLLFFHVLSAFLLVSGGVAAAVLHLAAMRAERPSDVATLLGLARWMVPLVAVGALAVLAFGIWLTGELAYSIGDGWIVASLVLWAIGVAAGSAGGRPYRRARELAQALAQEGDAATPELAGLVRDRNALVLNYASVLVFAAILVLMIWKPGA